MSHRWILLALAAGAASPAAAQQRLHADDAGLRLRPAAATAPLQALPPLALRQGQARRRSASTAFLHVAGGALIGAGAGFLASQVVWSDWDRSTGSEFNGRRTGFTLGGGAVGALAGLLVGVRGGAAEPGRPANVEPPQPRRANLLTEEEIRRSTALNVFELVQALRPQWLRGHGSAQLNAGEGGVRVYMDNALLGGVDVLRQLATGDVASLEHLDEAAATYRYGQGNIAGAIVVHSGVRR